MEGSGETESCKTSPSDKIENEISCDMKDGGITSSNSSTVEESSDHQKINKPSVRPYVRSKMTRLRWTSDLHLRFLKAVERLGGEDRATPKLVLQLMNIKGLNIAHVKSHLQMYRSKKIDHEPNQLGMTENRLFVEGVDQNMYNLSQLPLHPSFYNQRNHSNIRYGDSTWDSHRKWTHNSTASRNTSKFHSSLTEKILSSHYYIKPSNLDHCTRISSLEGSVWRTNKDSKNDEFGSFRPSQFRQIPIQLDSFNLIKPRIDNELKRKASDCELDLNLSLGMQLGNDELKGTVKDDENLLLSLFSSATTTTPSSSKVIKKLKNDIISTENAREMSTLDLTL